MPRPKVLLASERDARGKETKAAVQRRENKIQALEAKIKDMSEKLNEYENPKPKAKPDAKKPNFVAQAQAKYNEKPKYIPPHKSKQLQEQKKIEQSPMISARKSKKIVQFSESVEDVS